MSLLQVPFSDLTFLDTKLFEGYDFIQLLVRFAFNMAVLVVLIRALYYPGTRRRDYMFTFFMIGTIIFLLCFVLGNVKLQVGMALGLFAIFGILRYRTVQINIKEMTYLFMVIGVSVINALAGKKISYTDLIFTNMVVIGITWAAELALFRRQLQVQLIVYDKIELVRENKRAELIADLESRLGYRIRKIEIERISFLNDTARINVFYYEDESVKKPEKQEKPA
jgi:hypothetical protein